MDKYETIKSDTPLTVSPEQREKEIRMFGNTLAGVEMEYEESGVNFDSKGRLFYATCILSDAQEEMAMGNTEKARQFINKAKYHINKYRG